MFGLVLASFVAGLVLRDTSGQGTEIYHGGRGLPIPNLAALVTVAAVGLVGGIWLCQRNWRRCRHVFNRKVPPN